MNKNVSIDDEMLSGIKSQLEAQEPLEESEEEGGEEETSINNEAKAVEQDEEDSQESESESEEAGAVKHSESEIIRSLGEDKKKLADSLMKLASESDTAREQVKSMIANDPAMDRYMKTKFGENYDSLQEVTEKPEAVDVETVRAEERAKAKVEALQETYLEKERQAIDEFAELKAFTADEADKLKEEVDFLKGKYEFQEALTLAGNLVNPTKTSVSSKTTIIQGNSDKVTPEAKTDEIVGEIAKRTSRDPKRVQESLKIVEDNYKDGVLHLPM